MGATEIIRTIFQEFPLALYGSILVGIVCSFLGVYIVARRVVFLGAVLTQVSVMGLALTFLPFFPVHKQATFFSMHCPINRNVLR